MVANLPQSVLFCCDHNAVRSPMAEGMMKKFYGTGTDVQSVGVTNDLEIDGFSIAVCAELGVELVSGTGECRNPDILPTAQSLTTSSWTSRLRKPLQQAVRPSTG